MQFYGFYPWTATAGNSWSSCKPDAFAVAHTDCSLATLCPQNDTDFGRNISVVLGHSVDHLNNTVLFWYY